MFRALVVAAVSSRPQAEKFSLDEQARDCLAVCQARGWRVVETISMAHSRDYAWLHEIIRDCPEYADLVQFVETDATDLIVCRHYDRLWSNSSLQAQLSALCRQHRVQVFSILQPKEPLDPSLMPKRPGLQGIMESFSGLLRDEEQNIRVARRAVGMEGRIRSGRATWGPTPAYGYRRDKQTLVPDETESSWYGQMVAWIFEGLGVSGISNRLNRLGAPPPGANRPALHTRHALWSRKSVHRILANPIYTGRVTWGAFSNPQGSHPALITPERWQRLQDILALRQFSRTTSPDHVLAGLLRCGHCGYAMVYCRKANGLYLRCSWHTNTGGMRCENNGHVALQLLRFAQDAAIWAQSNREAWALARRTQYDDAHWQERLAAIEAQLNDSAARWRQWNNAFETGLIGLDELALHRQRIVGASDALRREKETLERNMAGDRAAETTLDDLTPQILDLPHRPPEEQRAMFRALFRQIVLIRGQPPRVDWW